jgi:hypothetical protein
MSVDFASTGDLADKPITFDAIGPDLYAFTAEGDPNSGVIVGDDGVMVIDAQATPVMARQVIDRVAEITDKPIKYVLLTHYHAVRVLGASAYAGAEILASEATRALIVERGKADMDSEIGRFPRLFRAVESIPGLTWPSVTFPDQMSVWLGRREVRIMHIGPAIRRAMSSPSCPTPTSCFPATSSSTIRPAIAATRTLPTGRRRLTGSPNSPPKRCCPAAAPH